MLLGDIVRRNRRRFPDDLAFVFKENRFTFKQYEERVNKLANALKALGIKKGDRVSVILDNCHQHYEILGAAAKGGFVMSPLSTALKQELDHLIGNAQPKAIIVGSNHAGKVRPEWKSVKHVICANGSHQGMHTYEELLAKSSVDDPQEKVSGEDGLLLYYTSGTTGLPKGAYLTNDAIVKNAEDWLIPNGFRYHNEVFMTLHPLYFTVPTNCTVVPAMYIACPVVITEQYSPEIFLKTVEKERVTGVMVVPTMVFRLLQHPDIDRCDISSLRYIGYGSAAMPLEVIRQSIKRFGNIFCGGYGLTESTASVTVLPLEDHKLEGTDEELRRLQSCGRELPNAWIRVVRKDRTDVTPNAEEVGEIIINCEHNMKEYFGMPEQTKKELTTDNWLHTGDMAAIDDKGYIYIKDRKKDMIITGGINVFPREIEEVLFTNPKIADAAVVGKTDPEWGEKVTAYVVLKPGKNAGEQEIIDFAKERLASYKKPKEVIFLESLPKGTTGKTLKRELRDKY